MNYLLNSLFFFFFFFSSTAFSESDPALGNQPGLIFQDWTTISSTLELRRATSSFNMGENFEGKSSSSNLDLLVGLNLSPWSYGLFLGYGLENFSVSKKNYNYFEGSENKERAGVYTSYKFNSSFYLSGKWTIYQELNLKNFSCEEYFYDKWTNVYDHTETLNKNVKFRGQEYEIGAGYHFSQVISASISYFSTAYFTKSAIKAEDHTFEIQSNYTITNNVPARLDQSGIIFSLAIKLY